MEYEQQGFFGNIVSTNGFVAESLGIILPGVDTSHGMLKLMSYHSIHSPAGCFKTSVEGSEV